jgi:hypothetical protein
MSHRRIAAITIAAAVVLDALLGLAFGKAEHIGAWNGLYFAVVTGTTTGYGDITPHGWLPHILACAIMILVIPLISGTFALLTSGLACLHIGRSEQRIMRHVEDRLRHHLGGTAM